MVGAQVRPIERTAEGALKPRAAAEAKSIVIGVGGVRGYQAI